MKNFEHTVYEMDLKSFAQIMESCIKTKTNDFVVMTIYLIDSIKIKVFCLAMLGEGLTNVEKY